MKCEYCGKEFKPRNVKQRYCSPRCCDIAYRRLRGSKPFPIRKCVCCGKEFQARHVKHKYCAECSEGVYSNPYVPKPKMIEHVPKPKPSKTLEQWVAEANECNLDYGTYRALIASGKTFDTLKATADNRQLQTHSHIKMCSR